MNEEDLTNNYEMVCSFYYRGYVTVIRHCEDSGDFYGTVENADPKHFIEVAGATVQEFCEDFRDIVDWYIEYINETKEG